MLLKELLRFLEGKYPSKLAEEWDNVGLMVGDNNKEVKKIMLCLDVTSQVIEEAKNKRADLIISHHPFIFKGLKRITNKDIKESMVMDVIKNDIAVVSLHTNLDASKGGVNDVLARCLKLKDIKNIGKEKREKIYKIVVFVPKAHLERVREAMCNEGAGHIGNYSHCTFAGDGMGSFKPLEGTEPFIGKQGITEFVEEVKLETVVEEMNLSNVISQMKRCHPYEEVAYDLFVTELKGQGYSFGKVGKLEKAMKFEDFLTYTKEALSTKFLRFIGEKEKIENVAVFSGSFDGNLKVLKESKADVLVTGDVKYHAAIDALEEGLCIIDAGHFATEVIVLKQLKKVIGEEFEQIKCIINTVEKDPFMFR